MAAGRSNADCRVSPGIGPGRRRFAKYSKPRRIAVRNVRRDGMDNLKQDEKKHEISEDERKRLEHEVQKLTDDTIKEIDEAAAAKEKEILGK